MLTGQDLWPLPQRQRTRARPKRRSNGCFR
ncbi:hypothetical protein H206_06340 [Candidatus Electrothrix aarhusensis]|uniref:Uncharacterized protein n=1 Tax=Candidatus Electrothrix aarhusensis TaxID=1859131 RepID=A0A444J317_9BACT|nr:hypothetical protein H206_06340 [Candidatus Electrothrix aarhusensis]